MSDATELWAGAMKLILMISPFLGGFMVIVYADEIMGLIQRAIHGRRRGDYD